MNLPCKRCIVLASCKAQVKNNNFREAHVSIIFLNKKCTILREYLKDDKYTWGFITLRNSDMAIALSMFLIYLK
jgi:hypothetical protein